MEVYILDRELKPVGIIDYFTSFIWTERYSDVGDFEMYLPVSEETLSILKQDNYVKIKDSEVLMVIEDLSITTEYNTNYITVKGRDVSSILDRRIQLGPVFFNVPEQSSSYNDITLYNIIKEIFRLNIYGQSIQYQNREVNAYSSLNYKNRKLPLTLADNTSELDPYGKIANKKPRSVQFNGDDLLSILKTLLSKYHLGFKTCVDGSNFKMSLYDGKDLRNDIVFTPAFDNISNIKRHNTTIGYHNILIGETEVHKEDQAGSESTDLVFCIRSLDNIDLEKNVSQKGGLDMRETYASLTDVLENRLDIYGHEIDDDEKTYHSRLISKTNEILKNNNVLLDTFECEIIDYDFYKLGVDYNLGDIVKVIDGFGHENIMRITEIIHSYNEEGYKVYPSLQNYEEDEKDPND